MGDTGESASKTDEETTDSLGIRCGGRGVWNRAMCVQPEEEPDRWQFPAALSLDNPQVSTWLVRACTVLPSIFVASLSPEVRQPATRLVHIVE